LKRTLSDKEAVLGVTGSIAAYKACELASLLVKAGVLVTPVLTKSATELVGAATFEAITGRRAIVEMFAPLQNPEVEHIAVATRADLFLIAPATANIMAKAAHGIADDWLSTTLLATRAPILFAPAMNTNMYDHPATQANLATLRERGCHFVGPTVGRLACGTEGIGKMVEPGVILEAAIPLLGAHGPLAGKRVVITSGGTQEPIDPVRFVANRSSGKMGRAIALEALARGAAVTMVSGPAAVPPPASAEIVPVQTAADMADACAKLAGKADVFIGTAAVADYSVESPATEKRKRTGKNLQLNLVENPDVIKAVAAKKRKGQLVVGFAAETRDLIKNATAKVSKKGLDLVVANAVNQPDSGFGTDTTQAAFIDRDGSVEGLPLMTKDELAAALLDRIVAMLGS
jgi:phosphopantothenoylcysteine decarboxylase / phosphopantothenate---cysteine ligase